MNTKPLKTDAHWSVKIIRDILKETDKQVLMSYSKINSFKSWLSITSEWVMIIAVGWVAAYYNHPLLYLFGIIFIGARMHALAVIMHEAVHGILFKNKVLNDIVGYFFCGWPIFLDMSTFRNSHLAHHSHLNTRNDPDLIRLTFKGEYIFPNDNKELVSLFLQDLFGITTLKDVFNKIRYSYHKIFRSKGVIKDLMHFGPHTAYVWGQKIFYVVMIPTIIWLIGWKLFLLLWIVPYATWRPFTFRIRIIAEHYALPKPILLDTRNVIPNFLENLFIVPRNLNYHLVHHLFPSVPQYNLPKLHKNTHDPKQHLFLWSA